MNNTVRDIMKLADAYAESLAELENENWVNGTVGGGSVEFVDTARAALEAAVGQLEKDAKRYRWLTVNAYVGIAPYPKPHEVWCLRLPNPSECNSLDAAIDAAMEAK